MNVIHLSRRNLLTLLSKLDRANDYSPYTACTLIKQQELGKYPTTDQTMVVAVEDEDYYANRAPGEVHPLDDPYSKV